MATKSAEMVWAPIGVDAKALSTRLLGSWNLFVLRIFEHRKFRMSAIKLFHLEGFAVELIESSKQRRTALEAGVAIFLDG